MRILNLFVFNDSISGVTTTWYSREDLERIFGSAEAFAVQADVKNVSGTLPALTVESEYSSDGQSWLAPSDGSNDQLGEPDDWLVLFATSSDASRSSPLVKVYLQRSPHTADSFYDALTRSSRCAS